ncbi:MAG: nicotinate-nucleotide--dimethylbenzimidazole phosphoribosyltransferase, partial [Verrucomicrobiota bacterium]
VVVDAGVGPDCSEHDDLHQLGFGTGTANFTKQVAIEKELAQTMVERGAAFARNLYQKGTRMICLGDMGIGNTTAASAVAAVVTGAAPGATAGRGTMVDDETLKRKVGVIERGIERHQPSRTDALAILSAFGGYETGFLCGCILGAATRRMPVILDGYPTTAAALLAEIFSPGVKNFMIAGHQSVEPGHRLMLSYLDKKPLINLSMRLGEGSGAALAIPIVMAATRCLNEMATFEEAAVANAIS